jgi:hypothetical protein
MRQAAGYFMRVVSPAVGSTPAPKAPLRKRPLSLRIFIAFTLLLFLCTGGASSARVRAAGLSWRQINPSGFGVAGNYAISSLDVFGRALYAGVWNDAGAQVWRTVDGRTWGAVTPPWAAANSAVGDAQAFGGSLYVGAANEAGGEIWRTDGAAWQQVASGGLGDAGNFAMNAFEVFAGQLYVATSNLTSGVEIWRSSTGDSGSWQQVNADGFGRGVTREDVTLAVYGGDLYVGISRVVAAGARAELWRSADGAQWTPIFTNGLGYASNTHVSAIAEFQGQLYIGLRNEVTGGQLWRSGSGLDWTPVFVDGLGAQSNSWTYGLLPHGEQLLLVFSNLATGAEVWRSTDGTQWAPLMQGGWGDPANGIADYFDKAAAIFHGAPVIGTANELAGGQIWMLGSFTYLPLIGR